MMRRNNQFRFLILFLLCFSLCAVTFTSAGAFLSSTLYNGCRGEDVRQLQQALIDLGFLKGSADGVFGNKTEIAVRAFQKKNRLTVDGLAGLETRELILSKALDKNNPVTPSPAPPASPTQTQVPVSGANTAEASVSPLFGSYAALRYGNKNARVRSLQQSLISLGYLSGSADGVFGGKTRSAVRTFQRSKKLSADGVAGKKTLIALENALSEDPSSALTPAPVNTPVPTPGQKEIELNPKTSGPDVSSVQLLHWFNSVKPSLSGGQHLLVWDPSSGLSWTLRVLARGRHCDAEPLTARDTRTMISAFGGVNTWSQKAVYVKLPDGRWSLASTHDMPHDSGTIKDNGFNGHLCVHFLRDMDEAQQNDPKYGVANQKTIRDYWKRLTGEDIP